MKPANEGETGIEVRQARIHQDDVWLRAQDHLDGRPGLSRDSDDLDSVADPKERGDRLADEIVGVDDDDPKLTDRFW